MKPDPAHVSLQIVPCGVQDAKKLSDIALRSYNDFYLYLHWFFSFTPQRG